MPSVQAKVVLLDIEGTTTSISFVKDTLFPYAKQHTRAFLEQTWNEAETQQLVQQLQNTQQQSGFASSSATKAAAETNVSTVVNYVNYLIDADMKIGPLKTLQGLVWQKGYADNKLQGHIYDDVPSALERWRACGVIIAIYSSGSVQAQKLLFGQTTHGNLLPYIKSHFDTAVGHKQDQLSYENIASELGEKMSDVLFLTDVVQEAAAAKAAGMQTMILARPGNAPLTDDDKSEFTVIDDFNNLEISLPL